MVLRLGRDPSSVGRARAAAVRARPAAGRRQRLDAARPLAGRLARPVRGAGVSDARYVARRDATRRDAPARYAFDYSAAAVARQADLNWDCAGLECHVGDFRDIAVDDGACAAAVEKGALDAVFLAGDGQVERAAAELARVLAPGGVLLSVSGVVPPDVRASCFPRRDWDWVRDGSGDLAAGCFVLRRR